MEIKFDSEFKPGDTIYYLTGIYSEYIDTFYVVAVGIDANNEVIYLGHDKKAAELNKDLVIDTIFRPTNKKAYASKEDVEAARSEILIKVLKEEINNYNSQAETVKFDEKDYLRKRIQRLATEANIKGVLYTPDDKFELIR